ncbi:MAG: transposase [Gemmatimonadales bacterium]
MGRFLLPQRSQVVRWRGALEGLLPQDHLARFVWQVVSSLDFSALEAGYRSVQGGPGRPPYHPRLLAALWVYGMTQGMETATAIAQACRLRDDFRWLAGGLYPSDQTLLNLLAIGPAGLGGLWGQVLAAMHRAGHVDLSALVEDGTKLRANASPRSFHTAAEITEIVAALERQLAAKLQKFGEQGPQRADQAQVRALKGRIERARQAAAELQQRMEGRQPDRTDPSEGAAVEPAGDGVSPAGVSTLPKFGRADFHHDTERDVLTCPAGKDLPFRGIYRDLPRSRYRLYRARAHDCRGCDLKAQCTEAPRRSLKIPLGKPASLVTSAPAPSGLSLAGDAPAVPSATPAAPTPPLPPGPRASITEPEAVMMLATSEKRWEPSYNADLTVTRHGLIVSQFLTKVPTDYHHFRRALPAVLSGLGRPDAWVGDGHYGTQENVLLAHRAGVVLYAPPAGVGHAAAPAPSLRATDPVPPDPATANNRGPRKFSGLDFRHDPERDVLICPAGEELRLVGVYAEAHRAAYRIYGRSGCGPCPLKAQCTDGYRRRVKLRGTTAASRHSSTSQTTGETTGTPAGGPPACPPGPPGEVTQLLHALDARMREMGDRIKTFRSTTIEPVNAQLKQHGLRRFSVRGLARCATVLTLACIAHNVMKWKAREVARGLRIPA